MPLIMRVMLDIQSDEDDGEDLSADDFVTVKFAGKKSKSKGSINSHSPAALTTGMFSSRPNLGRDSGADD